MDRGVDDRIVVDVDDTVFRMVGESVQGLVVAAGDTFGDSAPDLDGRVENSGLSNDTVNKDLDTEAFSGEAADAGVTGDTEFTTDAALAVVTDSPVETGVEERMAEVEVRVGVILGVILEVIAAPLPEADELDADDTVAAAAANDDRVDDADDDDSDANDKEYDAVDETGVVVIAHDTVDSDGIDNVTAEGVDTDDDVNETEDDNGIDTDDETAITAGGIEGLSPQTSVLAAHTSSVTRGSDLCQAALKCGSFNKSFSLLKMGSWYAHVEASVGPLLAGCEGDKVQSGLSPV